MRIESPATAAAQSGHSTINGIEESAPTIVSESTISTPEAPSQLLSDLANQQLETDMYALAARAKLSGSTRNTFAVQYDKDGSGGGSNTSVKAAPAKVTPMPFVGMTLGTNKANQAVVVKRQLGSTQGYDDRLQAMAVARMFKAEPAAIIQDGNGKWHAVETTAPLSPGPVAAVPVATAGAPSVKAIHGLPSSANIAAARKEVGRLRAEITKLQDFKQNTKHEDKVDSRGSTNWIDTEIGRYAKQLNKAQVTLASLVLGVPDSEIKLIRNSNDREAGKVNISADPTKANGAHGAVLGQPVEFQLGRKTAFEINTRQFDSTDEAAPSTMYHEVSHLQDEELAQEWVTKYQNEANRIFVASAPGEFMKWLQTQTPKRLSKADAEMVMNVVTNNDSTTEARANVRQFMLSLQSGDTAGAIKHLSVYARELKPGGRYVSPVQGSYVQAELVKELKEAYRKMPKQMQKDFDAAVAAAKQENPKAWVVTELAGKK